jgi:PPOX class probable F420-dependent enzyme
MVLRSQTLSTLTEDAIALLRRPIFAFVTTIRRDGSLHSTIVWVDEDNGDVLFNTAVGRAKERNLQRDPRVAVSLVDPEDGFHALSVSGTARFELEGADDVIERLSQKYTGRSYGSRRRPSDRPPEQRITVRVAPEQILYSPGRS